MKSWQGDNFENTSVGRAPVGKSNLVPEAQLAIRSPSESPDIEGFEGFEDVVPLDFLTPSSGGLRKSQGEQGGLTAVSVDPPCASSEREKGGNVEYLPLRRVLPRTQTLLSL